MRRNFTKPLRRIIDKLKRTETPPTPQTRIERRSQLLADHLSKRPPRGSMFKRDAKRRAFEGIITRRDVDLLARAKRSLP